MAQDESVQGSGLIVGVEWLRLVACIAIVAFHSHVRGEAVALGGLHAFTAVTVAFAARSARGRAFGGFVSGKFRTLLVPWLVWTAVYAVVFGVLGKRHGEDPLAWIHGFGWLAGSAYHLWFLPFAFFCALLLHPVSRGMKGLYARVPPDVVWTLGFLVALAVTCLGARNDYGTPFDQWLSVLPGVAVGMALSDVPPGTRSRLVAAWVSLGLVAALALGFAHTAVPLLAGLPLTVLAYHTRRSTSERVFALSQLSLGVYLLHPLIRRLLLGPLGSSPWTQWVVVTLLSLALTAALRRTPLRAVL